MSSLAAARADNFYFPKVCSSAPIFHSFCRCGYKVVLEVHHWRPLRATMQWWKASMRVFLPSALQDFDPDKHKSLNKVCCSLMPDNVRRQGRLLPAAACQPPVCVLCPSAQRQDLV
jgi:hypothetical protein